MGTQQRKIIFSGDVQGVGFRYTARHIAARFDVTGYVRNLPDGTVECVVEGGDNEIDAFLEALSDAMTDSIRDRKETRAACSGKFTGFEIRF